MNLDEGQKSKVAAWIEQGLKLAEIQNKLASELNVNMTYMDVRFLIDDLKLRPKDPEPAPPVAIPPSQPTSAKAPDVSPAGTPPTGGKVSLSVDQIARSSALVSGRVTFSDGQSAEWYLDQMGRLGMVPPSQGYRPPQADVAEFRRQLQEELAKMGL